MLQIEVIITHDLEGVGLKFLGLIVISSSKIHQVDLNFEGERLRFLLFHFMYLELASHEERGQRSIISLVWKIIPSEFFSFIFISHVGCKMSKYTGSRRYVLIRERR